MTRKEVREKRARRSKAAENLPQWEIKTSEIKKKCRAYRPFGGLLRAVVAIRGHFSQAQRLIGKKFWEELWAKIWS
jgi:hypothetical protein